MKMLKLGIKKNAPGEARTHNPGIAHVSLSYKYRALTNCATGAVAIKASNSQVKLARPYI